jgi:Fe-S cluster assembly protein SufD
MTGLRDALLTRDETRLPGRRDEDWRWTDLRGTLRPLPVLSDALQPLAPFDAPQGVQVRRFAAPATAGTAEASLSVAAGETLVLLDRIEAGEGPYARDLALHITLGEGATLHRLVLAADSAEAVSVSLTTVALAAGATLHQTVLATGAKRQRIATTVAHPGGGAHARLDGAYLLAGARHSDQTTILDHRGPGGSSEQLIRGVAADQGRGVFQGRITVAEGADGTDARLKHNALLLSDRAEIDAKPELEIYADDVACAHGNTVGALDAEALFYAMSRGIPEAEARLMLVEAFIGEIVERIGAPALQDAARAFLADGLEALRR